MTDGFSNERLTEIKPYGFLPYRLGKKIIYCNRPTPDVLWYERIDGQNVKIDALSFVSKPQNGLVALEVYPTERNEETKWKMALVLRGPQDQIYQFECGLDTVFAKGIMWAFCAADETEVRTGEIGINPTPADATKSTSKNPDKILYCNIFINGRDMPFFPGGTDHDWRELATIAMTKCNGCPPAPDTIPENSIFMDEKKVEKYNKRYGDKNIGQSAHSAHPVAQTTRSGVTYPNAPLKEKETAGYEAAGNTIADCETARQEQFDELPVKYNALFASLDQVYIANGLEIDKERLAKVIARGAVQTFEELTLHRKHQIIATLARELIVEKAPNHQAIKLLTEIVTPNPFKTEHYELLKNLMQSGFADLIPF